MISAVTVNQPIYSAFGLRFTSEIYLPELMVESGPESAADIRIKYEDLTEAWNESKDSDNYHAFNDGEFLLNIPDIAIYRVREGREISVSPSAGAEETAVRLYLLGSCMGALLIQRRTLPLHGSALVINGKAYAIVGDSGAGKSTLAAALIKRGYPLLSDDVIPVSLTLDRVPVVVPAYPQQKLWQESIEQLGMDKTRYLPIYRTKYAIPVVSRFCLEKVPLAGVFELLKTDKENVEIRRMKGLERLPTLQYHTYRNFLIPRLGMEQWHFSTAACIVSRTQMYQISRPSEGFTVDHLVNEILNAVQQKVTISHG